MSGRVVLMCSDCGAITPIEDALHEIIRHGESAASVEPTDEVDCAPAKLATTKEVSEYLRVPVQTLSNWRSKGIGPKSSKVGREIRYRWEDIDRWLDEQAGNKRTRKAASAPAAAEQPTPTRAAAKTPARCPTCERAAFVDSDGIVQPHSAPGEHSQPARMCAGAGTAVVRE